MSYGLCVALPLRPGGASAVLELLTAAMPAIRREDGCLAFTVQQSDDDPDLIWIFEAYTSKQYHDDVHESIPEVKRVLAEVGQYLAGQPVMFAGATLFQR